jgi:lipid kinase, YegS/Rv2252/BmrU family
MSKERILFIINPISGVGKQKIVEKAVEETLDTQLYDYSIVYTEYAHHSTAISLRAAIDGYDTVVAVGGDGSINDCVRGLIDTNVTLGIIPCGSGNGLARNLKIPLEVTKAIQVINKKKIEKIDTVTVNDKVYASIAGIGFDALIAREFRKSKVRGFNRYFTLVLENYPFYEPRTYELDIDGKSIKTDALFICFANANQFGYNTVIAPKAKLDDGYIEITIVKKVPILLMPWTAQFLFFRNFDKSMYVTSYKAKQVTVFNNDAKLVNLDGESVKLPRELHFSVVPHSLKVIIPEDNVKEKPQTNWSNIFNQPIFSIPRGRITLPRNPFARKTDSEDNN